jgi:hypothetical protein
LGSGQGKRKYISELIEEYRKRNAVVCKRKIEKVRKKENYKCQTIDNSNKQLASILKGYKREKKDDVHEKRD